MKTKIIMSVMALAMLLGLSSCSKDDNPESNYDAYQKAVNATVKSQKAHDKVILLVAFGSTWQQAYDAFDATVAAYKSAFPSYDVFLSFSSAICINRAAAGENVAPRNFYAPPFWLTAFAQDGVKYSEIVIQSLQVIPGEEYTRVINYIKDFANNSNGDLDDSYLSRVKLKLGVPLLQDADADVNAVAKALDNIYKDKAASAVVAFMGHGNPDSYDTYKANVRYTQLEEALQTYSPNYFVGTVDMPENFKTNVLARMQAAGITSGTVYCTALMSIAGDHAHNDMAGDDNENGAPNEEGEVEDTSWKCYFAANGYTCNNNTQIVKGLLELPTVRQVWMNHTTAAINGEPLDYYHSKDPE
ncbi:MAG: sirohydrochlorin cobaltochelatase [Bacteroidales bacterium]|nr:sirohydrochlorin cobaltochelatase [Bacteroidales bacterium]